MEEKAEDVKLNTNNINNLRVNNMEFHRNCVIQKNEFLRSSANELLGVYITL